MSRIGSGRACAPAAGGSVGRYGLGSRSTARLTNRPPTLRPTCVSPPTVWTAVGHELDAARAVRARRPVRRERRWFRSRARPRARRAGAARSRSRAARSRSGAARSRVPAGLPWPASPHVRAAGQQRPQRSPPRGWSRTSAAPPACAASRQREGRPLRGFFPRRALGGLARRRACGGLTLGGLGRGRALRQASPPRRAWRAPRRPALGAAGASAEAAGCAAAGASKVFGALTRRVPIRSGRVEGRAASTPCSSFLGFAFDFLGLSTLSAIRLRVYGSRSGRGARPPSIQAQDNRRRAVLRKFKLLDWALSRSPALPAGSGGTR